MRARSPRCWPKPGIAFADAPVARTRQAANDGTLSIMVGASAELFARIEPLLRYMGSDVTHCGEVGCGQVVKLINNTLLFEHVAAIAEMMVVAERAGVAPAKLIEAVGLGSGNSLRAAEPRRQGDGRRAQFPEQAFPSTYVLKDLGYAIELAGEMGVEPRMANRAARILQGGGRCRGSATNTSRRSSRWSTASSGREGERRMQDAEAGIPRRHRRAASFPKGRWPWPTARCWWSRSRAARLIRVPPDGTKEVVAELGGGPNGAAIGPDGACYVCNNGGFNWLTEDIFGVRLHAPARPRATTTRGGHPAGRPRHRRGRRRSTRTATACRSTGPNDIVFDAQGGFWFTDHGKTYDRLMDRGAVFYARRRRLVRSGRRRSR